MGRRFEQGEQMPDFHFDTVFDKDCSLSQAAGSVKGKTALIFLRYYGCTLCQYDIHQYAKHYRRILDVDGQILIVLQSDREKLAGQLTRDSLPFEIICDPDGRLYERFAIGSAASTVRLADPKTVLKMGKAMAAGLKHGEYEGNELQLPAVFVMDGDRKLSYVHYGRSAGDVPDTEELAGLL